MDATGDTVIFASQTNDMTATTNLTASVGFTSNRWCQVALTYTNGAVALYTNGVLCASASASLPYPGLAQRQTGFTVGSDSEGGGQAKGVFEDLETFNYPLSAYEIIENFQLTQPPNFLCCSLATIPLFALKSTLTHTIFGGDVSAFDGQVGEL